MEVNKASKSLKQGRRERSSETSLGVCMISHTRLNRDARVARAADTLLDAGYRLHVICLENQQEPSLPGRLSRATLHQLADRREALKRLLERTKSPQAGVAKRLLSLPLRAWKSLLAAAPVRYALFLLQAAWTASRLSPAIVHCHDLNVLVVGLLLKRLAGSRIVYDSHEIFTLKVGLRLAPLWRFLEKQAVKSCHHVITTTQARADFLSDLYPEIRKPSVIHNFPQTIQVEPRDIRQVAGLPADAFVALYQGGLQAHRGLEQLIESAAYLENAFVVIQGDGPLYARLCQEAQDSPYSERIRVLPGTFHEALRSFTASADVGMQVLQPVSVNHTTTLSNKLFEYIQGGLPVVASDFPMIRQCIEAHDCGILVDPTDACQIGQAVTSLSHDREKRQRLAANARQAAAILNWEEEEKRLMAIYKELEVK